MMGAAISRKAAKIAKIFLCDLCDLGEKEHCDIHNPERQMADHRRDSRYLIGLPSAAPQARANPELLYIHTPAARATSAPG
jgi:hypothetical protein